MKGNILNNNPEELSYIEQINRKCYDLIAHEYESGSHATVNNFIYLTKLFLRSDPVKRVFESLPDGFSYLDVGVGTGITIETLEDVLKDKGAQIDAIDVSSKMIEVAKKKKFNSELRINYRNMSIFELEGKEKYNLVVAVLADPYLVPEAFKKMCDLLCSSGHLIVTTPASEWAIVVRKHLYADLYREFGVKDLAPYVTFFRIDNNKCERTWSFSFCWDVNMFLECIGRESLPLKPYFMGVYFLDNIPKNKLSTINRIVAKRYGSNLCYYVCCVFRKRSGE